MTTYTIAKRFTFAASHVLEGLPEGHQCGRLHGHNYAITLYLAGEDLDPVTGMLVDFGDLKPFRYYIDTELDHRHLNDVLPGNPTAENLAAHLLARAAENWEQAVAVRVDETETSWAQAQR